MPGRSSPANALALLSPGMRVFIAGCFGEPTAFLDCLAADPQRAAGVIFTGVGIPGVNRRDVSAGVPDATTEAFFVTPELTDGFRNGRVRLLPLHYSAIVRHLASVRIDLAVMRVSPPNAAGEISFGVAADFPPDIAALPIPLVAEIDPAMPFAADGPTLPLSCFTVAYEAATEALVFDAGTVSPALAAIGQHVADLVRPGDTIQLGLGKMQKAALAALCGHRDLAIHGGMVSDDLLPLLDSGVVTTATTGVALGSASLLARAATDPRLRFRPTSFTHAIRTLAAIDRFVSINAALMVDLAGQSVSDMLDGRQVSGIGGLADFQRGAAVAAGGRPIIALAATTSDGRTSRIVPQLAPNTAASLARADAGIIITEHGIADCRGLDIDARAHAMVAIAAPQHRAELANAWDKIRRAM